MASSTGKTIALVLLVLFILFAAIRMTPLFFAPFGWVRGIKDAFQFPHIETVDFGPRFFRIVPLSVMSFILLLVWIGVIIWVYRDAERRGMNGILWALLVLIGNLIGLLIYLILRSDTGPAAQQGTRAGPSFKPCPSCGKEVDAGAFFCPQCGAKMEELCPECQKPVENSWKLCPYCGCKLQE
ncbi:MAG: zinc ribbon domain-containing protein [Candidatus Aminicenantes bacterium]|nr:zinc ribbon domain-containing protein [Candidatus Aminicenantes bacterium]